MPILGGLGGGQSLGMAQGHISIDTSGLNQVAVTVQQVSAQVERSFGRIGGAARIAQNNLSRISRGIQGVRTELAAIGAIGGVLTGLGLSTAGNLEEARIQLRGLVGGTEEANALMEDLRQRAAAAGLPFSDMLAVAVRLLPTLEGNTKELERWYDITRRVATLNRREGVAGAAFAINEALTSGGTDLVSLSERFNISRTLLREALAQTGGDFASALDLVLIKMGVTQQVADQMGRTFNASFRAAKDAALQLLAEGFTPLLEQLTPLLQQLTEWLGNLRATNPEVATLGANMAVAAAVGAPLLLLVNQLATAVKNLKIGAGLAALIKFFGGAGVGGAIGAASAGALLGLGGSVLVARGIGAATGREDLKDFGLKDAAQALIDTPGLIADAIRDNLPAVLGGDALRASQFGHPPLSRVTQADIDFAAATPKRGIGAAIAPGFTDVQTKAIQDWADSIKEIERDANQQRLSATQQYEQQRSETIASYERGIAREAEDFARQRARSRAQFSRQVEEANQDALQREAEWQADLAERVSEIRADANKRIAELEEDYNRDRERAQRDHRETLLNAAARLDANAVVAEQRRFSRQMQDAEEQFRERVSDERKNLNERIAEEQAAHIERLANARQADEERLSAMRRDFAEQERLADEDRAIRLQRMGEDHVAQLAEMETAQVQRMAQITQQAADEKRALDEAHLKQLEDLGIHNRTWLEKQSELQKEALKLFDEWWKEIGKRIESSLNRTPPYTGVGQTFADGGPVNRTGAALVHAGEYVLNPATTAAVAAAMGGSFSQAQLPGAISNRQITVAEGAIQIHAAPGWSLEQVGRIVRAEMLAALQTAA